MKHSLTLIELMIVVVFIGILLLINIPVKNNDSYLLVQEYEVDDVKKLKCKKI